MNGPRFGTPSWLPWLGPILAAGIGAAVGRFGLGGGFWMVLGAALVGTRPIVEMRIFDFTLCAMDELANQIAKIRYMTGVQARPALVVRMPHGMWRSSDAQHSQ